MGIRYFDNDLQTINLTLKDKQFLSDNLFRYLNIVRNRLKEFKSPSIYTGQCGVALMLYRVGRLLESNLELSTQLTPTSCYEEAMTIVESALPKFSSDRFTFVEGKSGALALKAALLYRMGESTSEIQSTIQDLLKLEAKMRCYPRSECEILYGRELNMPDFGTPEVVRTLSDVLQHGVNEHQSLSQSSLSVPPLLYFWHDSMYLGAAHGLIGILHTFCRFKKDLLEVDKTLNWTEGKSWDLTVQTTKYILTNYSFPSGNIMASWESETDKLVHWCHGAPGALMLIVALQEEDSQAGFSRDAETLGEIVWKSSGLCGRGLLKKGLGLCHGIGGMLRLNLLLEDHKWIDRAHQFALFGIQHFDELRLIPDRPYSMFEGLAGFVWFLCDALQVGGQDREDHLLLIKCFMQPTMARFPGMD